MGDDELTAIRYTGYSIITPDIVLMTGIRNQRMAEMRAQAGGGAGAGDQQKQMEERAKQMADMKNGILSQVLDQKVSCTVLINVYIRVASQPQKYV